MAKKNKVKTSIFQKIGKSVASAFKNFTNWLFGKKKKNSKNQPQEDTNVEKPIADESIAPSQPEQNQNKNREYTSKEQNAAATTIQKLARGVAERSKQEKQITKNQPQEDTNVGESREYTSKEQNAATTIQKLARGVAERNKQKKQNKAASAIQDVWKGYKMNEAWEIDPRQTAQNSPEQLALDRAQESEMKERHQQYSENHTEFLANSKNTLQPTPRDLDKIYSDEEQKTENQLTSDSRISILKTHDKQIKRLNETYIKQEQEILDALSKPIPLGPKPPLLSEKQKMDREAREMNERDSKTTQPPPLTAENLAQHTKKKHSSTQDFSEVSQRESVVDKYGEVSETESEVSKYEEVSETDSVKPSIEYKGPHLGNPTKENTPPPAHSESKKNMQRR